MNEQTQSLAAEAPASVIGLGVDAATVISYATHQNAVPFVRGISVANKGAEALSGLTVTVRCDPAFGEGKKLRIERLDPGTEHRFDAVDVDLRHTFLSDLNEAVKGHLTVDVHVGDSLLSSQRVPVEVLAYDQWAGLRSLPELLAAFNMPNHPDVEGLVRKASERLRARRADLQMNGYQSKNRDAVWSQVSAIYSAIAAENLHYSNPPANFTESGQKIRTADRILEHRLATCLDLALLMTSCLEQTGLNPVLVLQNGHAFVGCWLVNTVFQNVVSDDVQEVRKRVQAGELMVFEVTGLTHEPPMSLRTACDKAAPYLHDVSAFRFAIDVARARQSRITPLPARGSVTSPIARGEGVELQVEDAPVLPPLETPPPQKDEEVPTTPIGRLQRWGTKLLDLSLRNRLLAFRPSKATLRLFAPDPGALEDALAEGTELKFRRLPRIMEENDPRSKDLHTARHGEDPLAGLAMDHLSRKEITVDLPDKDLNEHLTEIYRAHKSGLEESGANTLYLAFGMLEWAETAKSEKVHKAPLLLVPAWLERPSVHGGFKLSLDDEEPQINPTLLEMLKRDFELNIRGLDPLPKDTHGVDVKAVWAAFVQATKHLPRWEVTPDVYLGIFSFKKHLMWKDLQVLGEQLKGNRVTSCLLGLSKTETKPEQAGPTPFPREDTLDDTRAPGSIYAPLMSDSSQLAAICAAADGHDFVLEGPPGTGKSQTITNIIAHSLTQGKTVLFVSEKMAALNVVYSRLKNLGLDPFCLELHSNKAKRNEVMSQLDRALSSRRDRTEIDWASEAARIQGLRSELNAFVRSIHRVHQNGLTVYEATGTVVTERSTKPAMLLWTDPGSHSREQLEAFRQLMRRISALAPLLGQILNHPLRLIREEEWSPTWEDELLKAAESVKERAASLTSTLEPIAERLGLGAPGHSLAQLQGIDSLADVLLRGSNVPTGFSGQASSATARTLLNEAKDHGSRRENLWRTFGNRYKPEVATLSGVELAAAWHVAKADWWPKKVFSALAVRGRLRLFRTDNARPDASEAEEIISALTKLNVEDRALEAIAPQVKGLLNEQWSGITTNWNKLSSFERWAEDFSKATSAVAGPDLTFLGQLREKLQSFLAQNREAFARGGIIAPSLLAYRDAFWEFTGSLAACAKAGGCKPEPLAGSQADPAPLPRLLAVVEGWTRNHRMLKEWCIWQSQRATAYSQGLASVVEAVEGGISELGRLPAYFEYSYRNWWLKKIVDSDPLLRRFAGADHEGRLKEFREADVRFEQLTKEHIQATLAAKIPARGVVTNTDSEMGFLVHEIRKQRKHQPIRQVVQRLPTLLSRLKPCLLMSPLSVAQYLATDAKFDLVVFDEASQIPVWDAVGAIARGKQVVVVGDPKQLPPTSFFTRAQDENGDEESEADSMQDLESILNECLGQARMPVHPLKWHYRSKHESLIAFSNARYYEHSLITFPSPVTQDAAVAYNHVPGHYDRGGSRTNRAEADAIVARIEKLYKSRDPRLLSVGVVTFNQPQQNLIETLLDQRRAVNAELDRQISLSVVEPLFIKNLENVQGDERDLILFSVTYAPDTLGRMTMSFGPLNLDGGHRRLNVAVTRARVGVEIYASLRPDLIDLSKVRAGGVTDLKHYLEYAIRGPAILTAQTSPTGREPDSPFEKHVISALRDRGWVVHPQVGCAGYRIDIGVVDPRAAGRYLCGVECDGASYHRWATARDRDRLRQQVLEGLQWHLFRIWSSDWWTNADREMERLDAKLKELLQAPLVEDSDDPEDNASSAATIAAVAPLAPSGAQLPIDLPTTPAAPDLPIYRSSTVESQPNQNFGLSGAIRTIAQQATNLIEAEGPIPLDEVVRRIGAAWGFGRSGSKVTPRILSAIPKSIRRTPGGPKVFLWPSTIDPDNWRGFRACGGDEASRRLPQNVAPQEIANIADHVLAHSGTCGRETLCREVARVLGISRLGSDVMNAIDEGLELLVTQGRACKQGESIAPTSRG